MQKYGGIYSYVPPQPVEDLDLCGSLKGYEYGGDEVASYILYKDDWRGVESLRFKVYGEYIFQRGMELIHRTKETMAEAITWNHEVIGNN